MRALWEELESLSILPPITEMNQEVAAYVGAMQKHQEEQKLSQILLMNPLHVVDEACNMIQQEESQREIFKQSSKDEIGGLAMSSKKGDMKFTNCGKLGQTKEKC
ncbi:hypothetical protein RDABS01_028531 [Bienertia sinuspersici]